MIGKTCSHYKIIDELGRGGMGVVYKAEDTRLNRFVALKFLSPELNRDAEAKERFIREARTASTLDHPNICTIYEINETGDGQMFISMAYYEGETLKQKIKNNPLPFDQAMDIAVQIARGLARAHEIGLFHRDIKPANILITKDGTVKIVDFGIAKLAGQTRLTKEQATLGTVAYLSPEQASAEEADQRTDIWALGVILYEMLTGELPFKGDYDQVIIYAILHEQPKKVTSISPDIPKNLERIVDKALQKELNKRYQTIDRMIDDLKKVKQHLPFESSRKKMPSLFRQKMKTYSLLVTIFMLFLIAFLIFKPSIFNKKSVTKPLSIAVISFENQTGNPAYDYLQNAIPNLLITGLEQSPNFQVRTWERLYDLLKQTGKEKTDVIDKDTGFELCYRDGINAVISGSFVQAGDIFVTDVKVLDVATKKLLKSVQSRGHGIESVLKYQIDQLSDEISKGIILPEKHIEYAYIKITDVTTSSLEAYHYYLRGKDEYYRGTNEAQKYFRKSIAIDTTFATAYLWLGRTYNSDRNERNKLFTKAKQFSYKTTKKEQLYIEAELEPDYDRKHQIYHQIIRQYPKEKYPHYVLAEHYAFHEKYDFAIAECEKALELDPNFMLATNSLCYWYAETGNQEKANEYLKQLAAISPGDALPIMTVANVHYLNGNLDESIKKYLEALEMNPNIGAEYNLSVLAAFKADFNQAMQWINKLIAHDYPYFMKPGGICIRGYFYCFTGQYQAAISDFRSSYDMFKQWKNAYFQACNEVETGLLYYEIGDYEKSQYYLNNFQKFFNSRTYTDTSVIYDFTCEPFLGLVDIRQGKLDSALVRLNHIKTMLPNVHITKRAVVNMHYQIFKAELLLAQDSIDAAIAVAENIKELPPPRYYLAVSDYLVFYNFPFAKDILARVYVKKGDFDKALEEYERLIHVSSENKDRRFMYPKYHYYAAKLYEERGQKNNAIMHLKKFLEIWKNADKDIPDFIDAKKRLSTLINKP
jgi:serine/threonine protein kinase/Tfp pilus assembly protein PilF